MKHSTRRQGYSAFRAATPLMPLGALGLLLASCANVWNAGDLADWVRNRAADHGCQRESIALEDWYTETADGNVWHGTCRDADGNARSFGINVDSVWKPSQ
jgi:hypothetical protein